MESFTPVELIVIDYVDDLPDQYQELLGNKLKTWQFNKIKIIHWEWEYEGEYQLLIDFIGYYNKVSSGYIFNQKQLIFEHYNKKLKAVGILHPIHSQMSVFEYVRKLEGPEEHLKEVRDIMAELKADLEEESVDEEEFIELVNEPYEHYSSDDVSSVSE